MKLWQPIVLVAVITGNAPSVYAQEGEAPPPAPEAEEAAPTPDDEASTTVEDVPVETDVPLEVEAPIILAGDVYEVVRARQFRQAVGAAAPGIVPRASIPTPFVHLELGGDDSRVEGNISFRSGPSILGLSVRTASVARTEGAIFSFEEGMFDGGEIGLRFAYSGMHRSPEPDDYRLESLVACQCRAQGLEPVVGQVEPSDEQCRRWIDGWEPAPPDDEVQPPCHASELDLERAMALDSSLPYEGWFFSVGASVEARQHSWLDMSSLAAEEIHERDFGFHADAGLGYFLRTNHLVFGSLVLDYNLNPPGERSSLCRNFPVGGVTTDPPTFSCEDSYLEPLRPAWEFAFEVGWRGLFADMFGAAFIADVTVFDGSLEDDAAVFPRWGMQAPLYVHFGNRFALNAGVRPRLRFDQLTGYRPDFTVSFFVGGSFTSMPIEF